MRSPFMLNSGWLTGLKEYLAPNCVAEAAMREGQKVGDWDVSVAVATQAAGLDSAALLKKARSPEIEKRVRAARRSFMHCR